MAGALQRAWQRRGPLALALWPLSVLYGFVAALRRAAYARGLARQAKLPVPVVIVGNVIAGGAGKTPVVMAIVRHLQQRGIAAGVVSRGYGRRTGDCRAVHPTDDPADTGDEPLLVRQQAGCPVFVAARRADAARALLAAHPETRVIVCDDGLQHHALARDIEVCVFDDRGTGNGWLLPAGPLREPWPRAVDFVLRPASLSSRIAGHDVHRRLSDQAIRADGAHRALAEFKGHPFAALAGIARPQAFFESLLARGLLPNRTIALPDHHDFASDVELPPHATILCTEKDAAKLWRKRPGAWAVPLEVDVAPSFWQAFDRTLDARLSSADGSQTA